MSRGWLVVVVLVLSGCESVPAPATQQELEAYCRDSDTAMCEWRKRCGKLRPSFDCTQLEASPECVSGLRASLRDGERFFDRAAARTCLEDRRNMSCESLFGLSGISESCVRLIIGTAREGERCGACASGLMCATPLDGGCGTCIRVPRGEPVAREPGDVGAPCNPQVIFGGNCEWQNYCARTADDGGVCTPRVEAGASCETAECSPFAMCTNNGCVALREPGETCSASWHCHRDLFCDGNVCVPVKPLGAACESNDQCQSIRCVDGVCRTGQVVGGACGFDVGGFCESNAGCVEGVCVATPVVGEACPRGVCAPGGRCVDGMCVDPLVVCR